MNNGENTANTLHIQPLNDDLLASLSIEELEGRLEMQIMHLTEAQACYDCGAQCSQEGCPNECLPNCECACPGYCCPECTVECGAECGGLCSAECSTLE